MKLEPNPYSVEDSNQIQPIKPIQNL